MRAYYRKKIGGDLQKKSSSLVSSFSLLLQCWCSILVMMHCNHFKALNSKAQGSSLINGTFRRRTLTAKCGAILQMSIILMARDTILLELWADLISWNSIYLRIASHISGMIYANNFMLLRKSAFVRLNSIFEISTRL